MKDFLKIAAKFFILLAATSVGAIEDNKIDRPINLPQDILVEIFQKLDIKFILSTLPCVCTQWHNIAHSETLFEPLALTYFGPKAHEFKREKESFKTVFIFNLNIANYTLKMAQWHNDDLLYAISDDGFCYLEKHLQKFFEDKFIALKRSSIKTSRDFAAMLIAYQEVALSKAGSAASHATTQAAFYALKKTVNSRAAWNAYKSVKDNMMLEVARMSGEKAAQQLSCNASLAADHWARHYYDWVNMIIGGALNNHKFLTINDSNIITWKLSSLIMWACASQGNFFYYYQKAFDDAKNKLDADMWPKMSKEKIFARGAMHNWSEEELIKNPYVKTLYKIAEEMSQNIE
jgi:hypothetical protein